MLRYMRENTGNWIIKALLAIVVLVFVFLGFGSYNSSRNNSVATIDGNPISIKEYSAAYDNVINQYRKRYQDRFTNEMIQALNIKNMVLNSLINQRVIMIQAQRLGIAVSDQEIRDQVMATREFYRDGQFSMELYRRLLAFQKMTPEGYEKTLYDEAVQRKLQALILSTINVSDAEAEQFYVHQNTQIVLDYILFKPAVYKGIVPEAAQIEAYYDKNKSRYQTRPMMKAAYIKFSPSQYQDKVTVDESEAKAFYEQQIQRYQEAEKVQARHILIKVGADASEEAVVAALKKAKEVYGKAVAGQDFEQLARNFSEGPSKTKGGFLAPFEKSDVVKAFGDKAFSMKPGEISEPVRTEIGWHIIKVEAHLAANTKTFEQVRAAIVKELKLKKMQKMAYEQAGIAFDEVMDGADLDQAALVAKATVVKTEAFDRRGRGLSIPNPAGFAQAAFELETDTVSDVKEIGGEYYLILAVEKMPPADQPLEQIKEQVVFDLTAKLQREKAKEAALAAVEAVKKGTAFDAVAKTLQMKVETTKMFNRSGNVENTANSAEFIKAGFTLSEKNRLYSDVVSTPEGFYVIYLKERKLPLADEIKKNLEGIKNRIRYQKSLGAFEQWLEASKKHLAIKINPSILN